MKIRCSEVFRSFQGEGLYTGSLSIWVRLFGCNLNCHGFAQKNPTDPKTWILPVETIDLKHIAKMEDLPVLEYGCDSGYSWSTRFKHLAKDHTEKTLAAEIMSLLPTGTWEHPKTNNFYDLCFTGGEPMMQQKAMMAVMDELGFLDKKVSDRPIRVQIETNGTKPLTEEFKQYIQKLIDREIAVCFNISPKLWNVAGEKSSIAWKPEIIKSYLEATYGMASVSSLKFVVNGHKNTWKELDTKVEELYNLLGYLPPVFIMPVGGTKEQQEDSPTVSVIANEAIARGYMISGRVHANIFGNAMAT